MFVLYDVTIYCFLEIIIYDGVFILYDDDVFILYVDDVIWVMMLQDILAQKEVMQ